MGYRQISQWQGWPAFSLEDAVPSSHVRKQGIGKGWVCTHRLIVNAPERGGARGKEEEDGVYY